MLETLEWWGIVGFLLAMYPVVANDSIQTLGTFIASNSKTKWYWLWAFASFILALVLGLSFFESGVGDIASGRLQTIPFQPIQWYHALAPLGLIIITRQGIPVSTSYLILSIFSSSLVFEKIILKSVIGFGLAAVVGFLLWVIIAQWDNRTHPLPSKNEKYWRVLQWIITGFLWYTWLSHDIANVAVFHPRTLTVWQLGLVLLAFIIGLAFVFRQRGGRIQKIILEKKNTTYLRSATVIDLCYALILLVFKEVSSIPMSTTWVFIGLLSGRELALSARIPQYSFREVFPIVRKDFLRLLFGLVISVLIALMVQNIDAFILFFESFF